VKTSRHILAIDHAFPWQVRPAVNAHVNGSSTCM
jgi:hypothetical protein